MPSAEMQLPKGDPASPDDGAPTPATSMVEGVPGVPPNTEGAASEAGRGVDGGGVDCCSLLANAPVWGDHYDYHVDCDPLVLPDCAWRREFGEYCNRWPPLSSVEKLAGGIRAPGGASAWHPRAPSHSCSSKG